MDATGRIAEEALARTFAACDSYAAAIREFGATRTRFVATSAMRDAENRDEFAAGIAERFGVEPEIISGDEEAALSFAGATGAVAEAQAGPAPYLVIDLGGGSTEFVLGDRSVAAARSIDMGSVRLTERHFAADPPTPEQIAAARRDIAAGIDTAAATVPLDQARSLVGVAGSITTVAALALGLEQYERERVHLAAISAEAIHETAAQLLAATHDERAARKVIDPGRVDVIAAGALVTAMIVERLGLPELIVSESDILDGIAASIR